MEFCCVKGNNSLAKESYRKRSIILLEASSTIKQSESKNKREIFVGTPLLYRA
jgi:hypothetical protein